MAKKKPEILSNWTTLIREVKDLLIIIKLFF